MSIPFAGSAESRDPRLQPMQDITHQSLQNLTNRAQIQSQPLCDSSVDRVFGSSRAADAENVLPGRSKGSESQAYAHHQPPPQLQGQPCGAVAPRSHGPTRTPSRAAAAVNPLPATLDEFLVYQQFCQYKDFVRRRDDPSFQSEFSQFSKWLSTSRNKMPTVEKSNATETTPLFHPRDPPSFASKTVSELEEYIWHCEREHVLCPTHFSTDQAKVLWSLRRVGKPTIDLWRARYGSTKKELGWNDYKKLLYETIGESAPDETVPDSKESPEQELERLREQSKQVATQIKLVLKKKIVGDRGKEPKENKAVDDKLDSTGAGQLNQLLTLAPNPSRLVDSISISAPGPAGSADEDMEEGEVESGEIQEWHEAEEGWHNGASANPDWADRSEQSADLFGSFSSAPKESSKIDIIQELMATVDQKALEGTTPPTPQQLVSLSAPATDVKEARRQIDLKLQASLHVDEGEDSIGDDIFRADLGLGNLEYTIGGRVDRKLTASRGRAVRGRGRGRGRGKKGQ